MQYCHTSDASNRTAKYLLRTCGNFAKKTLLKLFDETRVKDGRSSHDMDNSKLCLPVSA